MWFQAYATFFLPCNPKSLSCFFPFIGCNDLYCHTLKSSLKYDLFTKSYNRFVWWTQSKTEVIVQLTFILQLCAHAHSDFVHIKDGTWQRHCVRHGRKSWGLESHESEKIMAEYSFLRALNNYFDCQWIKQLLSKSAQHQMTPSTKMLQCKLIM